MMLKIYTDLAEAQRTILKRHKDDVLPESLRQSLRRIFGRDITPSEAVAEVLADVRSRDDAALRDWMQRIDGVTLDRFAVDPIDLAAAADRLSPDLLDSLRFAADRIRAFHVHQPLPSWTTTELGGTLGQQMTPLDRVGVYVPAAMVIVWATPPTLTWPLVRGSMPPTMFSSVVLPEPLGPSITTSSPGAMLRVTSRSACTATAPCPYVFVT